MSIEFAAYRAGEREQARIADLFALIPEAGERALDIGARDGYLAKKLAERFGAVIALDLERPEIDHPRVTPVKGDVTHMDFPEGHFDLVLCAEVLEHIPSPGLERACAEIARIARGCVVIGVPYRQDLRLGRTTCQACGQPNPPWGHVNRFDEDRLRALFSGLRWVRTSFVGANPCRTNRLSALLLDYAGNPFGTYDQEEACVHCGQSIGSPAKRSLSQHIATRLATILNNVQAWFAKPRPIWIHILFTKPTAPVETD